MNTEQRAPSAAVETVCALRAFISASGGYSGERTKESHSLGHGGRTGGNKNATWTTVRAFVRSRSLPLPCFEEYLNCFRSLVDLKMLLA